MAKNQPNDAAGKEVVTSGCDTTPGGIGSESCLELAGTAVLATDAATAGSEVAAPSYPDESPMCSESVTESGRGEVDGDGSSDGNGEQGSFDVSAVLTDFGMDGRTRVAPRENDV